MTEREDETKNVLVAARAMIAPGRSDDPNCRNGRITALDAIYVADGSNNYDPPAAQVFRAANGIEMHRVRAFHNTRSLTEVAAAFDRAIMMTAALGERAADKEG